MRPGLKYNARDAAIAGVVLAVLFGLIVLFDYRVGGIDKFEVSLQRLIHGSTVEPGLSIEEIEARLAHHLTDREIRPGLMSAASFTIDGCIAAYRIDHTLERCNFGASWWKMEKLYDLRLLRTTPWSVEVSRMQGRRLSNNIRFAGNALIRWKFREEAAERLVALRRESRRILHEERVRYGSDVQARLKALKSRYQTELPDRIFETNGERVFFCDGLELMSPEWTHDVHHFVRADDIEAVVDLMHAYKSRACPFDPAALE